MVCADSRARRAHPSVALVRALALLGSAVALVAACGGDSRPARVPSLRNTARASAASALGALVAAGPARDVAGAAARIAEPPMRGELDVLGSRLEPHRLPIPRVAPGRSARFSVDGGRKGWFLRLPEGAVMKLTTASYARGRVYLGGGFGSQSFYGVDANTGRIDWAATASDGGPTAAIIEDDKVLFNTESCTLFAVDARTGRQLWSHWLGDPLMSQPAAANGRVYTAWIDDGGNGYRFGALDLRTGRLLWQRFISADVLNAPVLDDTDVYFTTMDGVVWSMTQAGRLRWRKPMRASSAPWLDGDSVHVVRRAGSRTEQPVVMGKASGSLDRTFDAVSAPFVPARPDGNGTQAGWEFEGSRPTIVDGRIYQTIGSEVVCRDARTGEVLWRQRHPTGVRGRPASAPAVAGSQLVFGTSTGELYGLDVDTGLTTWAYDVGEPIAAQPTVANGWVYATTTRGGLVGVQVADRTFGGWHMWGGNAKHSGSVPADADAAEARSAAADERPSEGTLRLGGEPHAGELAGFPLTATRVHASVHGFVASVEVEQTFTNPFSRPVEAVYLFPLPDDAAVDQMELRTGTRVVRGHIARREEARREYRAARSRGVLTSLLEQERPNLFQQSVANIRPGDTVKVVLRYVQSLPYEEGSYRFVYPMVAGPRYTPSPAAAAAGHDAPTPAAPPAAPVLAPGTERRDRVEVTLDTDGSLPIRAVDSPTHAVTVDRGAAGAVAVRLRDGAAAPVRDLDVRLHVAGDEPDVRVLSSGADAGRAGYLTVLVHPRLAVADAEVAKRELVFLVDTSSSMRGRPIELARAALTRALDGARPTDTLRLVRFSDAATSLSEHPLAATPANVARAKQWVAGLEAGGATEMKRGLRAALDAPADSERMRIVLLVTDGYIGNETEIFRDVSEHLGQARVFALGVGSSVNRYLLNRLAETGRGDVQVVTLEESPERAAERFSERIARPFLTDVSIDWGGLDVRDVYPRRLPDVFADRPIVVEGRYGTAGQGTVTLRGRIGGRAFSKQVPVTLAREAALASDRLPSLWARTRIHDLETAMTLRPSDALREQITAVGLEHSLLTEYTAFVAVDEGYQTGQAGEPVRVAQPVSLPQGVDYGGVAARPLAWGGGSLGLSGTGYGGGGVGYGSIGVGSMAAVGRAGGVASASPMLVERSVRAPAIHTAQAQVTGALSAEVVRAEVRRQMPAFRACYESALRRDPTLAGRVTVRFLIGPDGRAASPSLVESQLADESVYACIAGIVRRMTFGVVPGGGTVAVSYPFNFQPGDQPAPAAVPAAPGDAVDRALRALDRSGGG